MCKCKNCDYIFKPNEGRYNTPSGLFCIECYDKPSIRKKVWDDIEKTPPLEICLGKKALLTVGVDNRPTPNQYFKFVRVILNDVLLPEWYFICENETDVYYFFEKYYSSIIHYGVGQYMRGNQNTYWGKTILKLSESPKYEILSPAIISSYLENETYVNRCELVKKGETLLLKRSGLEYLCLNSNNIKIIQEREYQNMHFPDEKKYTIDDISIKKWDDGIHYYAKIGRFDIISKSGEVKYFNYEDAKTACLEWLSKQDD